VDFSVGQVVVAHELFLLSLGLASLLPNVATQIPRQVLKNNPVPPYETLLVVFDLCHQLILSFFNERVIEAVATKSRQIEPAFQKLFDNVSEFNLIIHVTI
jgi:hypothetical protein